MNYPTNFFWWVEWDTDLQCKQFESVNSNQWAHLTAREGCALQGLMCGCHKIMCLGFTADYLTILPGRSFCPISGFPDECQCSDGSHGLGRTNLACWRWTAQLRLAETLERWQLTGTVSRSVLPSMGSSCSPLINCRVDSTAQHLTTDSLDNCGDPNVNNTLKNYLPLHLH